MANETKPNSADRPRVGVSSCLLGQSVRYDGGHKRDAFLVDVLGKYVDWTPVCPEFEVGLGIPRAPLHLRAAENGVRLVISKTDEDLTARMATFAEQRLKELARLKLSGYVLKSKSPSCGMERVRIYSAPGIHGKTGSGVFASFLIEAFPYLPIEEEGRLQDPRLRENFVTRVYAYHRWQQVFGASRPTSSRLMKFHEQHKFVLMSHSQAGARELGRLVAEGAPPNAYLRSFSEVMKRLPTRKTHTNVLQHIAGFLKDRLDSHDRRELAEIIDRYRRELLPLIVPITLLQHYAAKDGQKYLREQVYLQPHPHELMLLNHV